MNARLEPARFVEIIPCAIIHMEVFTAFALMDTEPPTTTRHLFPMMARTVQVDITKNPELDKSRTAQIYFFSYHCRTYFMTLYQRTTVGNVLV